MLDLMLWKQNWQTWLKKEMWVRSVDKGQLGERTARMTAYLITARTRSEVLVGEIEFLDAEGTATCQ